MSYLSIMARKASRMSTAEISKQFGMPAKGPKGKKVEFVPPGTQFVKPGPLDPQNVEDVNRASLGGEEEPTFIPKKKGMLLPADAKFPGRKKLVPAATDSTLGKRRAPSSERSFPASDDDFDLIKSESEAAARLFAEQKGKKQKFVPAVPVETMVGKRANPITLADVEASESSTSDANAEMTALEEEGFDSPEEKKRLKDAENSFEKSLEYSKRMRSTFEQEMADLNAQLMGIEIEQDAMEMCDTSFFDNDQANYYNDYADDLERKKKKIEEEIERLQGGQMKKKTGTKRVASTRSKPRSKTRRVAVKRAPVKARRRKSTSSGRRAPGSPARSR